jgi:STE24 endopeptidase
MSDSREQARAYARIRYRLMLVDLALGCAILAALQWSGASLGLAQWMQARTGNPWLVVLGYLAGFGLITYLLTLPLHLYSSFFLEHRFGLSRLSFGGWCSREAKRLAVTAVLSVVMIEGLYAILRQAPESWPLWATAGWVGISVILARVFPTVLLPIFYKTTPLQNEALSQRLLTLCQRVGLPVLGIFRFELGAETRKANAALAGLGGTRRVLLADTLISEFPPDEIEGVLAHELAHHHYRHITKFLILSAIGFLLTDYFVGRWVYELDLQGLSDIAGFPVLMLWLSVLHLISLPLQNGLSRRFEWQADRFAVQTTSVPKAFAEALRRLAQLNLADPNPPKWITWLFYDHPPIMERIAAAEGNHEPGSGV